MIEEVCKISFSRLGSQDKFIWIASNNGKFSVKSAYPLEVRRRKREVKLLIGKARTKLGKKFGTFKFQIALKYSFGKLLKKLYPQS